MPPRPTRKTKRDKTPQKLTGPVTLPADDDAFVRLPTVLAVYPVGETSWWNGVADGRYPAPVKLSKRVNGWRVGAIRRLLAAADDAA
jgi:predicted DNA-binding transcriptional regulator AlpA